MTSFILPIMFLPKHGTFLDLATYDHFQPAQLLQYCHFRILTLGRSMSTAPPKPLSCEFFFHISISSLRVIKNCNFIKKEALAQVFSSEFCEVHLFS